VVEIVAVTGVETGAAVALIAEVASAMPVQNLEVKPAARPLRDRVRSAVPGATGIAARVPAVAQEEAAVEEASAAVAVSASLRGRWWS
jgi:hypothetical protein